MRVNDRGVSAKTTLVLRPRGFHIDINDQPVSRKAESNNGVSEAALAQRLFLEPIVVLRDDCISAAESA